MIKFGAMFYIRRCVYVPCHICVISSGVVVLRDSLFVLR